ncbi:SDR family NAD(P)-dependent oxidoreductase, partial [Acidimicrobiaceae bacterium USS-CC1]|nr:SDR family NAD(P)-dependent oxidoreductase [Acidiferrimicrobium australe]
MVPGQGGRPERTVARTQAPARREARHVVGRAAHLGPGAPVVAVVLVTGAGRGLGAAIAARLAADGARVGLLDRDEEQLARVAAEVPGGVPLGADILDEAEVEAALDRLEAAAGPDGSVTGVVNNAGVVRFGPLLELAQGDFRAVTDVNLVGTFTVARAAARRMAGAGTGG